MRNALFPVREIGSIATKMSLENPGWERTFQFLLYFYSMSLKELLLRVLVVETGPLINRIIKAQNFFVSANRNLEKGINRRSRHLPLFLFAIVHRDDPDIVGKDYIHKIVRRLELNIDPTSMEEITTAADEVSRAQDIDSLAKLYDKQQLSSKAKVHFHDQPEDSRKMLDLLSIAWSYLKDMHTYLADVRDFKFAFKRYLD